MLRFNAPTPIRGICRICRCLNYFHTISPAEHVYKGKYFVKYIYIDELINHPQYEGAFCRMCDKSCDHIRSTLKLKVKGVKL